MKQKTFALHHLTFAVVGTMTSTIAMANTAQSEPMVNLGHEVITIDRQGTKVKTNVVTLQEKNESTATNMRELLKDEPAIDIGGGTGSSQYLTIRGMGQNSVDIKVDNAHSDSQILYHQGRFILDPSLVKIVSVQKGAGSASAGIGATNGAILAKTVDAKDLLANSDKDYGVKLNLGYSSNNSHNYGATAFARSGAFDGLISYNIKDESNFRPGKGYKNGINGGDDVPYSALKTTSYLAKVGATLDNHRFVLSHMKDEQAGVRTIREEYSIFNSTKLTMKVQAPAYRANSLSNTNLEWTADNLGFVEKLTANAYMMKNERYSADDRGCGYCGYPNALDKPKEYPKPIPTTTKIETKGANLNLDVGAGEDALVKYGINYRHQQIKPGHVDKDVMTHTPEKTEVGAYVEAIGYMGDFTVTGGMRYDHFDITSNNGVNVKGNNLSPSFGVIYQATPNLSFSANHNYASRGPRLYDALMVGIRSVSIAPNLKAEQARNTEVGFNYNNGNFGLDATYFWQKVDNVIVNPQNRHGVHKPNKFIPKWKAQEATNDGYSKNHGYEVGASYRYNGLTARLGVAESNPRYFLHNTTKDVNPEFAIPVGRTWTSSLAYRFAEPNLELGVRNRTVEESKKTVVPGVSVDSNAVALDGPLSSRKGYNVTDVFANWKPYGNDKMNVNFSVNNVENKFYHPHSQRAAQTTIPGVGREFRVGVNFTY